MRYRIKGLIASIIFSILFVAAMVPVQGIFAQETDRLIPEYVVVSRPELMSGETQKIVVAFPKGTLIEEEMSESLILHYSGETSERV